MWNAAITTVDISRSRSYYYGGRYYNGYYRSYYYGGYPVYAYAPAYYYGPGFYGWAYNPWAAPVAYSWGWGGNPWYGYYGGSGTLSRLSQRRFWLTDYLVSQSLAAAYQEQVAAQVEADKIAPSSTPVINKAAEDLIAEEVKRQIALENRRFRQRQRTRRLILPPAASLEC